MEVRPRLSIERAADALGIDDRTLWNYETGANTPSPEVALAMSRLYSRPELTHRYCNEVCAIGKAYCYEFLDAVNSDPISVLAKMEGEIEEFQTVFDKLLALTVNKNGRGDFSENEWDRFIMYLQELFDVEHNIEMLKISLGRWCDVSQLIAEHNRKCEARGYTKRKTATAIAV
jgi:transcriptional regulator with XRE-family HTH domain